MVMENFVVIVVLILIIILDLKIILPEINIIKKVKTLGIGKVAKQN